MKGRQINVGPPPLYIEINNVVARLFAHLSIELVYARQGKRLNLRPEIALRIFESSKYIEFRIRSKRCPGRKVILFDKRDVSGTI